MHCFPKFPIPSIVKKNVYKDFFQSLAWKLKSEDHVKVKKKEINSVFTQSTSHLIVTFSFTVLATFVIFIIILRLANH